jgi:hypothetical protein
LNWFVCVSDCSRYALVEAAGDFSLGREDSWTSAAQVFIGNFDYECDLPVMEKLVSKYGELDHIDLKTGAAWPTSSNLRTGLLLCLHFVSPGTEAPSESNLATLFQDSASATSSTGAMRRHASRTLMGATALVPAPVACESKWRECAPSPGSPRKPSPTLSPDHVQRAASPRGLTTLTTTRPRSASRAHHRRQSRPIASCSTMSPSALSPPPSPSLLPSLARRRLPPRVVAT